MVAGEQVWLRSQDSSWAWMNPLLAVMIVMIMMLCLMLMQQALLEFRLMQKCWH